MTTDKNLLRNRFAANLGTYNTLAVVQDEICGQLDDLLAQSGHGPINNALEIGAGTGFLSRRLLARYPAARWTVNDLVEEARPFVEAFATHAQVDYLWGDAEAIDFPPEQDLVASASTIQWFDALPAFLRHAYDTLTHGGTLALSTFGPENFREINSTTGEGLHYYDASQFSTLLCEAGFELVELREYTRELTFGDPCEVLRHIRATGVNSIRRARWTPRILEAFETAYRARYSLPGGGVTLTYHPLLVVASKN